MKDEERIFVWIKEWYGFIEKGMEWFKDYGVEWIKVEVEFGDFFLWDFCIFYYNVFVKEKQDCLVIYICFMFVLDVFQVDFICKKDVFESDFFYFICIFLR